MYFYKKKNWTEEQYLSVNCTTHLGNWKELKDDQCLKKKQSNMFPRLLAYKTKSRHNSELRCSIILLWSAQGWKCWVGLYCDRECKNKWEEEKNRRERSEVFCNKGLPSDFCTYTLPSPWQKAALSWSKHSLSSISTVTDFRLCPPSDCMSCVIRVFLNSIKPNLSPPKRNPTQDTLLLW